MFILGYFEKDSQMVQVHAFFPSLVRHTFFHANDTHQLVQ